MQEHVKRMIIEKDDLDGKIKRCRKALAAPPFGIDEEGLYLLSKQCEAMESYSHWLNERLKKEGVN